MADGKPRRRRKEVRDMEGFADGLDRLMLALTILTCVVGVYATLSIVDGRVGQLYEWAFIGVCVGLVVQIGAYFLTRRRHRKIVSGSPPTDPTVPFIPPPVPNSSFGAATSVNGGSFYQPSMLTGSLNNVVDPTATPR